MEHHHATDLSELVRFGVSLDKILLERFDGLIRGEGYSNRSEAIRDLIRDRLVKKEWESDELVAGVITLIYDHHQANLLSRLTELQHEYDSIISSFHVHLTHRNCLEVISIKDKSSRILLLTHQIKSIKGVKHCELSMCTLGENM